MATVFITRVELYGEPAKDIYTKLHAAMEQQKFFRTFKDGDKYYEMPHAMYISSHTLLTKEVVTLVKKITSNVWKNIAVLVTKTEDRIEYDNLKQVKKG